MPHGGVHFRVWASERQRVAVIFERSPTGGQPPETVLSRESGGYFSGLVQTAVAGCRYRFRLDDEQAAYPDPVSRWQPDGVEGASEIVDPDSYSWHDQDWAGVSLRGQVIYEMHIGTFSTEGTWAAAMKQLPHLAETGVTLLEIMPVTPNFKAASAGVTTASIYSRRRGCTARPTIFAGSSMRRMSMVWA